MNLTGVRDDALLDRLISDLRVLLEAEGVAAPTIRTQAVASLRRGRTGKAPLIMGLPRKARAGA